MKPDFIKEREDKGLPFDLYFAGSNNKKIDEYLVEKCGNRLFSQLNERSGIKYWIVNKKPQSKLFVDSGAYTAYTKGVAVDVNSYIEYINQITDYLTIFAQVDKIPGMFNRPKSREEILEAPKLSWYNYLYMRDKLKQPDKLIPIFHQGEDYKWLHNMLEWTDDKGHHIPYIGISPAVDMPCIEQFLNDSFRIISESSNPNVKTHAFGMTQLSLLEKYPYYSADSTSWLKSGSMGSIYTPWGMVYVSDRRDFDSNYIFNKHKEAQERILDYVKSFGFSIEEVRTDYVKRLIINVQYLLDWASSYKFKGTKYPKKLF